jgi:peroxiredoxin
MLEQGTQAPDFDLPDENGDAVKLSDLKGQTVVLYFYPKADTRRWEQALVDEAARRSCRRSGPALYSPGLPAPPGHRC